MSAITDLHSNVLAILAGNSALYSKYGIDGDRVWPNQNENPSKNLGMCPYLEADIPAYSVDHIRAGRDDYSVTLRIRVTLDPTAEHDWSDVVEDVVAALRESPHLDDPGPLPDLALNWPYSVSSDITPTVVTATISVNILMEVEQ